MQESYAYDADGERVTRTRGGVTTVYLGGLVEEDITPSATRAHYVFAGQVVAWYKEVLVKGGWHLERGDDRALWFWYQGGEDDSSYRLTVFARSRNTGPTSVKLRLVIEYAM